MKDDEKAKAERGEEANKSPKLGDLVETDLDETVEEAEAEILFPRLNVEEQIRLYQLEHEEEKNESFDAWWVDGDTEERNIRWQGEECEKAYEEGRRDERLWMSRS